MRTRAGLGVRKSPRERRVGAGLVEGRALPRPLGWPDTEQLGAGAGAGPQLLPRLRREEAVPAGAKGAGQGLRAFSRCIIPGPPPPSAGAAAGPEAASLRRELQKWSLSCRPRSQARDPVTKSAFLQRSHGSEVADFLIWRRRAGIPGGVEGEDPSRVISTPNVGLKLTTQRSRVTCSSD
ncbi:uncharacterized protein LOC123578707 isoform X7 [Leopardus geoffroyi]|uniref:uncharacterized protein LOC123578707 isoform X7 n=1 Tax=Leopardus geoffroyi TaxID=46844 RepID=UPI001E26409B|nr:uncharacterized protein LOC123578707 isoform X7 [Leopardus geoffroyi]